MNPMQMATQMMMNRLQGNPLMQRAQQMAQGKSESEIQEVARNLCKNMGFDYDKMYGEFTNRMNQSQKQSFMR